MQHLLIHRECDSKPVHPQIHFELFADPVPEFHVQILNHFVVAQAVFSTLLSFYQQLGKQLPCTDIKKRYIAGLIARVIAGKFKIMLSFPPSAEKKQQLRQYDRTLKEQYRDIYDSNINKAVSLLRKTQYHTYYLANMLVRRTYR